MREHDWPDPEAEAYPESDAEQTGDVPVVDVEVPDARPSPDEAAQEPDPDVSFADELLDGHDIVAWPQTRARRFRKGVGKVLLGVGGLLTLIVLLYTADLMISAGRVPRGVTVLGIEVGGMTYEQAETKLRGELEPRLTKPIPVNAGDVQAKLDPADAGLHLDWPATLEQAGNQPLSPITRVLSFFSTREVGVVTQVDPDELTTAVTQLANGTLNHGPTEGSIGFNTLPGAGGAVEAFAIEPRQAQRVADVDEAVELVKAGWLRPEAITIPVDVDPVRVSSEAVHATLEQTVKPLVSGPVAVQGKGKQAVLRPVDIAAALRFTPTDDGALAAEIDQAVLRGKLLPTLAETERDPKDAAIEFADSQPNVRPSEQGRKIDWAATLAPFIEIASKPEARALPVVYATKPAAVTTADAEALGIKEVVGEFTTSGFSGDVAGNVAAIAAEVNGAIVKPGETFRLNERTGPRTASQGYTVAPFREDGTGAKVLGGGVSQLTTTLYNAAYLAGLKDAGHTAHTHYFDRYPAARDARSLTSDGSSVGMAFTNDTPTGIAIQAYASGSSVTVKIWGTKHYRVESKTGERTDVVEPPVKHESGEGCEAADGAPGFTVTSTRTLYDAETGDEVRSDTSTTTYQPRPKVICDRR